MKKRKPLAAKTRQKIAQALRGKKKKGKSKLSPTPFVVGGAVGGTLGALAAQKIIDKRKARDSSSNSNPEAAPAPTSVRVSQEAQRQLSPAPPLDRNQKVPEGLAVRKKTDKRKKKAWGFPKDRSQIEKGLNKVFGKRKRK